VQSPQPIAALPRLEQQGTRRGRNPEETLRLVSPFFQEAGITRVAVVHKLDVSAIPVVMVTRPLSASLSVSQGKGVTLAHAKVSGVMEAIEHFHAETIEGNLSLASLTEILRKDPDAHCDYAGRLGAFSPHVRCLWKEGRALLSGKPRWVPFDLVHLDLRTRGRVVNPLFVPTSNGLASGNSLEEATAHALYEIVERHNTHEFLRMSAELQEARRLSLSSVGAESSLRLLQTLESCRIHPTIWDLTNVGGMACFLCEIVDREETLRQVPMARGFGCHSSADVALSRAICEAAQSRVTMIAGSRDDMSQGDHLYRIEQRRQLIGDHHTRESTPARHLFRRVPSREFESFEQECDWLGTTLVSAGFEEPIVVDLSKPGWPVHVVKVIVPGMRFDGPETQTPESTP
jgi:YcaO-like protein with predicted kinase domain